MLLASVLSHFIEWLEVSNFLLFITFTFGYFRPPRRPNQDCVFEDTAVIGYCKVSLYSSFDDYF